MNLGYLIVKRIFDILISILALILCIIPWLIISIIIKVQSPGPVIYKAKRIGKNGKIFTLFKFRSMKVDSGAIHLTTLRGDSRIFPFGEFLRKSKLDETPQIINILKGEMSIIGPRPEDKDNAEELYIGKYKKILSVKPGLSSPASLYDYTHGEVYSDEELYIKEFVPKKLDMELYYINNRNCIYDIQIIVRTIITILLVLLGNENFNEPKEVKLCKK